MCRRIFLALGYLWVSVSAAQSVIKGRVIDAVSRQPLEAAYVVLQDRATIALTDQNGNFLIKTAAYNSTITASFMGYKPLTMQTGAKPELQFELLPDVVSLKSIILTNTNAPEKFSTLAKVDLDLKPVKNTQELMRVIPGLFIAQHAGGGKAEQIFLRGFDCDHGTDIQVSVDGIPVNMVSHAHGQGYSDAHFIIPETVNTIDYGTGPYYAAHGNLNTAGYIGFSTYKNIPASVVQVEAGRFDTYRALAMVDLLKQNKDRQSAYVAGEFIYTNGPTRNPQHFNRFNLFGKYNLQLSSSTVLTATLSGFKSKWNASGQVPTRAVVAGIIDRFGSIDPTEGGHTERYNTNLQLTHRFKNGLTWTNQAYYVRNIFSLYSNFTFFLNDPVNGDGINQAEKRDVLGYNSTLTNKSFFRSGTLTSTYAAGVRYDATKDSYLSNVFKRSFLNYVKSGNIKEANTFAFVDQQFAAGKWLFNVGARVDYFYFGYFNKLPGKQMPAQRRSIVSPKFNIQYNVDSALQVYVKAGKGFHSNDTRVVVENSGHHILPAAYGADLGFLLKPTPNLLINVAAWYLYLQQEFVYVGDNGIVEPAGRSRREGIDLIARFQLTSSLFTNANFNITRTRAVGEPKGMDKIPLAPTFTSTGGVYYKRQQGFNGGFSYRYIKDRPANEDNSIVAKGYFLVDASVNYLFKKVELGLAIENLLNTRWNEAQFATRSRLYNEQRAVEELHYTPGTPFFIRGKVAFYF